MQEYLILVEFRDGTSYTYHQNNLMAAKAIQRGEIKWEGTKRATIYTKLNEKAGDFAWLDNNEQ
jgi:hypothetical protein